MRPSLLLIALLTFMQSTALAKAKTSCETNLVSAAREIIFKTSGRREDAVADMDPADKMIDTADPSLIMRSPTQMV